MHRLVIVSLIASVFVACAGTDGNSGSPDGASADSGRTGSTLGDANGSADDAGSTPAVDDGGRGTQPPGTSFVCGTTPRSRLAGTTYAPNAHDALPNVLVYVAPDTLTLRPPASAVSCVQCMQPAGALLTTTSAADGTFALEGEILDQGGTFTVVFESGGFRHVERHVTVARCTPVAFTPMQSRLPGANAGDDTVPRIAVAGVRNGTRSNDVNDNFAHVIDSIGITEYDLFDPDKSGSNSGTGPDVAGLLSDMSRLSHYDILITPCGTLGNFTVATHLTPAMVSNLRSWLALGGRFYASDLAYSLIDRTIPGAISFPAGHPTRDDPAIIGVGQSSLSASVDDPGLRTWLRSVGAMAPSADTIPVRELRDPWGAVDSVPSAMVARMGGLPNGRVFVSGDVQWHELQSGSQHRPLTVQVDYPGAGGGYCGRVVFTSYHVESASTATLSPQERVLEYLFFRLTTCIDAPG